MYTRIHIRIHIHIHVYVRMQIHIHIHTPIHIHIHTLMSYQGRHNPPSRNSHTRNSSTEKRTGTSSSCIQNPLCNTARILRNKALPRTFLAHTHPSSSSPVHMHVRMHVCMCTCMRVCILRTYAYIQRHFCRVCVCVWLTCWLTTHRFSKHTKRLNKSRQKDWKAAEARSMVILKSIVIFELYGYFWGLWLFLHACKPWLAHEWNLAVASIHAPLSTCLCPFWYKSYEPETACTSLHI